MRRTVLFVGFSISLFLCISAVPVKAVKDAASSSKTSFRFTPIEQIQEGDFVFAFDEASRSVKKRTVERTFRRISNHIRIIQIRSAGAIQTLKTTDEHPFWTAEGWLEAEELRPGMKVLCLDGVKGTVESTERIDHPNGISVFNFRVAELHTYYVAENELARPVLVHNANYLASGAASSTGEPILSRPPRPVTADDVISHYTNNETSGIMHGVVSSGGREEAETLASEVAHRLGLGGLIEHSDPRLFRPGQWPHFHIDPPKGSLTTALEHVHFWWMPTK